MSSLELRGAAVSEKDHQRSELEVGVGPLGFPYSTRLMMKKRIQRLHLNRNHFSFCLRITEFEVLFPILFFFILFYYFFLTNMYLNIVEALG